ncbi:MAG: hypothetical protein AAGB51_03870 [Planctomycetota bacterium]
MHDLPAWVLLTHAGSTLFLVGLAWFVFVVHYPLFARIPAESFAGYEAAHVRRTTYVVAPVMLIEFATGLCIFVLAPAWPPGLVGIALLAAVWGLTFGVQVPQHRRLEAGLDLALVGRLVRTHGIRTLAWTGRGAVAIWMLA